VLRPSRQDFHALARDHTVVPVWRELLADQITPVAAFSRLTAGDSGPSFLLESVEHGERWGRFSFIGRSPSATLVARGRDLEVDGDLPASVPRDRGVLGAIEALLDVYRSPSLPELPPWHGGLVGYLGYDVVREVERLPGVPPDDIGNPDAVLSVIGDLAVFDHWRQRVALISNAIVPEGTAAVALDDAYDRAVARVDGLALDGARPLAEPMLDPPDPDDPLPEFRSTMPGELFRAAVEAASCARSTPVPTCTSSATRS
jgi:anthranilate synthase component 1